MNKIAADDEVAMALLDLRYGQGDGAPRKPMYCSQLQGSKASPWQIDRENTLRGWAVGESPGFSKQCNDVTGDYILGKYVHVQPAWFARDPCALIGCRVGHVLEVT
eukprot:GHVT01101137.1.p1 GENE.GHVT01101137.1~~GHVT01101137.1.p1  ORF type:complete len:106 (-),score=3.96 GHVT01101137.1:52-369(-)